MKRFAFGLLSFLSTCIRLFGLLSYLAACIRIASVTFQLLRRLRGFLLFEGTIISKFHCWIRLVASAHYCVLNDSFVYVLVISMPFDDLTITRLHGYHITLTCMLVSC